MSSLLDGFDIEMMVREAWTRNHFDVKLLSVDAVDQMVEQWRRERPDVDPSSMALFARLSRAHVAASGVIEATLGRHGLKRGEFDLLASLRRSTAPYRLSPGALASAMVLSPAATTHRIQRLEGRGLVTRRPNPDDGRLGVVELTDAGRELVDVATADHVATLDRLVSDLPERERAALTAMLAAVERNAAAP
jgi:DNA-binding MarR family transcriptional regulator